MLHLPFVPPAHAIGNYHEEHKALSQQKPTLHCHKREEKKMSIEGELHSACLHYTPMSTALERFTLLPSQMCPSIKHKHECS